MQPLLLLPSHQFALILIKGNELVKAASQVSIEIEYLMFELFSLEHIACKRVDASTILAEF